MTRKLVNQLRKRKPFERVLLFIHPLILFYTNAERLAKTLWHSRILTKGHWSRFNRFRPHNGINSLFYWTQALNLDRFGRSGTSPYVGTGDYHLGHWWHLSLTSSYLYWRLGAMLPVLCTFGWLASHSIWYGQPEVNPVWLLVVASTALLSTLFYAGAFVFLNYNAFGWLFVPVGLFGLLTENYFLAAIAWLGASLGSLTVVFIASWIALALAISIETIGPLLTLVPAAVKLFSHLLFTENKKVSLLRVAKAIGFSGSSNETAKYNRKGSQSKLDLPTMYFTVIWSLFLLGLFLTQATTEAALVGTVLLLGIINRTVVRFADPQSLYMGMFSVATACLILNPNIWLLVIYWIGVSPLPALVGSGSKSGTLTRPVAFRPFEVGRLVDRCTKFLESIPTNSRILLSLSDPKGDYNAVFDGYRVTHELLYYTANRQRVLVFPDWWAIFENNKPLDPGFWGESPSEVSKNLNFWNGDHVVVRQESGSFLEPTWVDRGFTLIACLDWATIVEEDMNGETCWGDRPTPKWFLLKAPAAVNS